MRRITTDEVERWADLWDGSELWYITRHHWRTVHITVQFTQTSGPTITELILLRQWLPHLRDMAPATLRDAIGNNGLYDAGVFGGREGEYLLDLGQRLGLNILAKIQQGINSHIICRSNGIERTPEDPDLLEFVLQKMQETGCPIIENEED